MIKVDAYKTYFGGKSGSGTYQQIINRIPPHKVFVSGCLGNCGVTRHIKPAELNILNDLDSDVVSAWLMHFEDHANGDFSDYQVWQDNVVDLIRSRIAEKYDTEATFIYLDPPYQIDTRKSKVNVYKHEMTKIDHELLLAAIKELKHANVMISAYPNGLYDEVLAGWTTYDFYSKIRGGVALERLYYNYALTDKLHDYSYIGDTFREREKNKRIKNNYLAKLQRLPYKLRNSILQDLIALNCDVGPRNA